MAFFMWALVKPISSRWVVIGWGVGLSGLSAAGSTVVVLFSMAAADESSLAPAPLRLGHTDNGVAGEGSVGLDEFKAFHGMGAEKAPARLERLLLLQQTDG